MENVKRALEYIACCQKCIGINSLGVVNIVSDLISTYSFYRQVRQRIRVRRSLMDISKEKLGLAVGKSGSQISRYEKREGSISALTLHRIADQLHAPIEHFIKDYKFICVL